MVLNHKSLSRAFAGLLLPRDGSRFILFALRGALPKSFRPGWSRNLTLTPERVDYLHQRCTVGIWNPVTKTVFAAAGSTVPHRAEVLKAAEKNGKGANQMEPGYYPDFYKGEHLMGKKRGHQALRQTAYRFVRRASHGPPYTVSDPLFYSNPYDNLHCAWNSDHRVEGYSSAGCIVVAGLPFCKRLPSLGPNSGPWKAFHDKIYEVPQKKFSLLLLPFADFEALDSKPVGSGLLCFGSEGERVEVLQLCLREKGLYRGPVHGRLDALTYKAWNRNGLKKIKDRKI